MGTLRHMIVVALFVAYLALDCIEDKNLDRIVGLFVLSGIITVSIVW